ncbi:MAG: energy transducer TonB [Candidatus Acidiferrales bacterium]
MPDSALDPKKIEAPTRFRTPLTSPEAAQWRVGFWRNLRDFLAAPARSPRTASAAAGATSTLAWPAASHLTRAQTISLAFHSSLIVLLLLPAAVPPPDVLDFNRGPLIFSGSEPPLIKRDQKHSGGGSGGNRQNETPTVGKLPPNSWIQLTAPRLHPEEARLKAEPTYVGPPEVRPPEVPLPNFGDPDRLRLTVAQGPGSGNGFGENCCGGNRGREGPGSGPGQGGGSGDDGGFRIAGRNAGMPVCAYCPNPTFTDEAVKTKYQGSVVLRLVVTEEGKPAHVSVVRGIGMGLDERALEAVKTWRFQPARGPNGRPEAVWVTVEVMFRQF